MSEAIAAKLVAKRQAERLDAKQEQRAEEEARKAATDERARLESAAAPILEPWPERAKQLATLADRSRGVPIERIVIGDRWSSLDTMGYPLPVDGGYRLIVQRHDGRLVLTGGPKDSGEPVAESSLTEWVMTRLGDGDGPDAVTGLLEDAFVAFLHAHSLDWDPAAS